MLAYDESVQVLRDHETYSSRGLSEAMGPLFEGAIIAMDEPEHRLYRALVAPAFRPKVLERWQTTVVQPAIDNVIDTFIDHDRVDLVEHLTFAFPVRVIARILGLPEQDVANFQRWSLDLINMFNDPEPGVRALEEFRSYFMAFITERRLTPATTSSATSSRAKSTGTDSTTTRSSHPSRCCCRPASKRPIAPSATSSSVSSPTPTNSTLSNTIEH